MVSKCVKMKKNDILAGRDYLESRIFAGVGGGISQRET